VEDTLLTSADPTPLAAAGPHLRTRLQAALEIVVACGLPTQLALGAVAIAVGLAPFGAGGQLSTAYLATVLSADTAVLIAFVWWRLRTSGDGFTAVLLGSPSRARDIGLGLALIPVFFGAVTGLMAALRFWWPGLHSVETNPFEALFRTRGNALLLGAVLVVSGGLKEEVQRGFILHRFDQGLGGARVGLVVYSLVFGAGHLIQGYDVGVTTALMGLAWGMLFLRRRSIVASSISHAGFNAAQIVRFLLVGA
jgi:membrane protease YdiL (CAAX protease family)